jgi:hypothetical protein
MKFVLGVTLLLCLGTGPGLADPPSGPASVAETSAPVNSAAPATPATTSNPSSAAPVEETPSAVPGSQTSRDAPSAPATPAPSAQSTARNTDEAQVEKQLRAQGYSVQMRNGEKVFCRRNPVLGSRLPGPLSCLTAEEAETIARSVRDDTERQQQRRGNCLMGSKGTMCGG